MSPLSQLRSEAGFTLVELLVATVLSLVVMMGLFATIEFAFHQTSDVTERISANQRGRVTMEYLLNELHSSCVAVSAVPVRAESGPQSLYLLSETGNGAYFASMTERRIFLEGGTLYEARYASTGGVAPRWKFATTPASTRTILKGVSQREEVKEGKTVTIPLFRYFKYAGSTLPETELAAPLTEENAKLTAAVEINFATAPERTEVNSKISKAFELSDLALLRFDPASTTSQNTPCT